MAVVPQPETQLSMTLNWTVVRDTPNQAPFHAHMDHEWWHVSVEDAETARNVMMAVVRQFPDTTEDDGQLRSEFTLAAVSTGRRHFAERVINRLSPAEYNTAKANVIKALTPFGKLNAQATSELDTRPVGAEPIPEEAAAASAPPPPATPAQPAAAA